MTKPNRTPKTLTLSTALLLLSLGCRLSNPINPPTNTPPPPPTSTPGQPVLPLAVPNETILIEQPLGGARLTSPIELGGLSGPTFEQTLVVLLSGPEGEQLAVQPVTIAAELGQAGPYQITLPFSVETEMTARLSIYDVSARDGGLVHLSSVIVTLLPGGASEPGRAVTSAKEAIHITRPLAMEAVAGGTLMVSGYAQYFNEGSLQIALCGAGGSGTAQLVCGTEDNLLAEGLAAIASPEVGLPGPFSVKIEYRVSESTAARLVVYSISAMDGAIEHLASREIVLHP